MYSFIFLFYRMIPKVDSNIDKKVLLYGNTKAFLRFEAILKLDKLLDVKVIFSKIARKKK